MGGRLPGVATVTAESAPPFRCVLDAWRAHETELHAFLIGQVRDPALADDLLQDVFLKAVREGARFCGLDSPRAWLFQVTRHLVIDRYRVRKPTVPVADALPAPESAVTPVEALSACLEHALQALDDDDRDVVQRCDIDGQAQRAYAEAHGLSVPAVKARIQRARARLRHRLIERCGVRFDADGHVCCHGHCHPPSA
jgi:RNA polymerase sigma-70 factor (ECF subfamily)